MVYFEKTSSAPVSLSTCTSYNDTDVLELLHNDFKNKCYICESKGIESINVEHFAPHKDLNEFRKYSWFNLFWACSHCNKIKSAKEPFLNCTCKDDCVDTNIKYSVDKSLTDNKIIIEGLVSNLTTNNTVQLLKDIYNGTTQQSRFQAREKRNKLYDELCDFTTLTIKYQMTEDNDKKRQLSNSIQYELSNASSFTAFKRWVIRDNAYLLQEFGQYIQD
jgi:hypothetical protein